MRYNKVLCEFKDYAYHSTSLSIHLVLNPRVGGKIKLVSDITLRRCSLLWSSTFIIDNSKCT